MSSAASTFASRSESKSESSMATRVAWPRGKNALGDKSAAGQTQRYLLNMLVKKGHIRKLRVLENYICSSLLQLMGERHLVRTKSVGSACDKCRQPL